MTGDYLRRQGLPKPIKGLKGRRQFLPYYICMYMRLSRDPIVSDPSKFGMICCCVLRQLRSRSPRPSMRMWPPWVDHFNFNIVPFGPSFLSPTSVVTDSFFFPPSPVLSTPSASLFQELEVEVAYTEHPSYIRSFPKASLIDGPPKTCR